jgi:hypothetical protein
MTAIKLCECGCGAEVKNRFVLGHAGRGKPNVWRGKRREHAPNFKGKNYACAHQWLARHYTKDECELCGSIEKLEWAYKGEGMGFAYDRAQYNVLCRRCHLQEDRRRRKEKQENVK